MSFSDLVSIIIPTYNRAQLLLEALESAKSQTYRPIEVIVVDDGSTDNTQEIVSRFKEVNSSEIFRVSYLRQQNKGPSAARNHGLSHSSGEYLQFLDSDDLIHPRKIEIQVGLLKSHPSIHLIFSEKFDFQNWPNWEDIQAKAPDFQILKGCDLYCSFNTLTNSGLYKKETCLLAGLWDEEMSLCEDLEFNLRVLNLCHEVLYTKNNLAGYRRHNGDRLTTSLAKSESRYASLSGFKHLQESALYRIKEPDQKLFESIGVLYNRLALDFMMDSDRAGALQTIYSCRQMPLSKRRSRRLNYLTALAYMPASWLRALWKIREHFVAS
jgi:glycosyltransferase involved in cell wall biosynthesis